MNNSTFHTGAKGLVTHSVPWPTGHTPGLWPPAIRPTIGFPRAQSLSWPAASRCWPTHSPISNPHLHRWDMVPPGVTVMDATVATEYGWAQFYNSERWCKCGKVCACHASVHNVTQSSKPSQKVTTNGGTKGVRKGYERVTLCTKGCTKGGVS